jgi:outer membrane protein assembly factor BamB
LRDASISVKVEVRGITPETIPADIDGQKENSVELTGADGHFTGSITTQGLLPGFHYLHAKIEGPGDLERAVPFLYWPESSKVQAHNLHLPAGMQAGPVAVENGWLLANTEGRVTLIPRQPEFRDHMHQPGPLGHEVPRGVYPPGAEIIRSPAVADDSAYFSSAERGVICVDLSGKLNWKRELGTAVYGTPAVTADAVYVGDMEGRVHALDRKTGEVKWTKPIATFGIEMPLLAHQGVLYFGSWDGQLYAVNAADGARQWASPGPAGHEEQKTLHSRYYAPADCPPLIIGARLFVVDRSYRLGSYTLEGKYLGRISEDATAIGLAEDGQSFYCRGYKALVRYDRQGQPLWSKPLPLGRFPCPPTAAAGRVYVCSDMGVLSVLDAAEGKLLWQYQVSPRLHVMAPVGVAPNGDICVAGMDGSVLRLRETK